MIIKQIDKTIPMTVVEWRELFHLRASQRSSWRSDANRGLNDDKKITGRLRETVLSGEESLG